MTVAWTKASSAVAPRIIVRRSVIVGVLRRWKDQYPDGNKVIGRGDRSVSEITARLEEIDLGTCDRKAVDDAIGNDSWTKLECDVCEIDREELVSIPREYSEPIAICADCASGILSVLKEKA